MELLLVGGGHASLSVLKRAHTWTRMGIEITLLNDHPDLYYSGMMPEYPRRIRLRRLFFPREARRVYGQPVGSGFVESRRFG